MHEYMDEKIYLKKQYRLITINNIFFQVSFVYTVASLFRSFKVRCSWFHSFGPWYKTIFLQRSNLKNNIIIVSNIIYMYMLFWKKLLEISGCDLV